jgi:hypothetical protein
LVLAYSEVGPDVRAYAIFELIIQYDIYRSITLLMHIIYMYGPFMSENGANQREGGAKGCAKSYDVVNFSVPDNFVLGPLPIPTRSVSL